MRWFCDWGVLVVGRELESSERTVLDGMLRTINQRSKRNHIRKNLYDAKNKLDRVGFSVIRRSMRLRR